MLAVLAAAAAVTTGCSTTSGGSAAPTRSASTAAQPSTATTTASAAATPAYYKQKLTWRGCGDGLQCATLKVPLDYANPASRMIDVAVIRKPARDAGKRIGSLVLNPGGPGGSGLDYVRCCSGDYASLNSRFDIVSFDPRGVGQSSPIRCLTSAQLDAYVAVDPTPDDAAERQRLIDSSREFAAACKRKNGDLLAHVSTREQARDMDVLRAALGDRKLTYIGKSYGTFLGAKYAEQFPTRIRALVLDGALDPAQATTEANRVQAMGFELQLRDFLEDCVAKGCPLGSSVAAADTALRRLQERVDASPIKAGSRTLGPGEFFLGLAAGLYSPQSWPSLRFALAQAQQGVGQTLLYFTDSMTERRPNGTFGNLIEANTAINCIDRPSPRDVSAYDAEARQLSREAPHFGGAIAYGSLPCAFWPVPPVEPAEPVRAAGAPTILVIGTTHDPATPYEWSQALARELASGVLLTYDGDGHTAYGRGSKCIDRAVDRYVLDLVPPRNGTRCR